MNDPTQEPEEGEILTEQLDSEANPNLTLRNNPLTQGYNTMNAG